MNRLIVGMFLVLVVFVGVGLSYWEWRQWKHEETKNYGQGPGSLFLDAENMSEKLDFAGFDLRIRYPMGWKTEQDARFLTLNERLAKRPNSDWGEVLNRSALLKSVTAWTDSQKYSEPVRFVVELGLTNMSATDYVSAEVVRMKNEKLMFEGDREYRNSEFFQWTVLTYGTDKRMFKRAYAVSGEKLMVVTVDYSKGSEFQFLRTFEEFLNEIKFISA